MKLYISGPMTGYPKFNELAFADAAHTLAARGHETVIPFDCNWNRPVLAVEPGSEQYMSVLRKDLREMLDCDMVVMLPGSERSRGAQLEKRVAEETGIPVMRFAPETFRGYAPLYNLVGLSGKKRTGKDATADIFVRSQGFVRVAFADALKEMALQINPQIGHWDLHCAVEGTGWSEAKKDPEVRHFLQVLGETQRVHDPMYWIRTLEASLTIGGNYVISDVRYRNEAEWIERHHGLLLRIERPETSDPSGGEDHPSETDLDDWDWLPSQVVLNDYEGEGWQAVLEERLAYSLASDWLGTLV